MKYKVGDKVRIKSRNCIENLREVTQDMLEHCEMIMTIDDIHIASASYIFKEDCHKRLWTDEMIEGLVEEEMPLDKAGQITDFEAMYSESERIYNEEYSTGEYCHEQSFKWGFQEGFDFVMKLIKGE